MASSIHTLQITPIALSRQQNATAMMSTKHSAQKRKRGTGPDICEPEQERQAKKRGDQRKPLAGPTQNTVPSKSRSERHPNNGSSRHNRNPRRGGMQEGDGHYILDEKSSTLGDRYSQLRVIGQGTYGKVVKARDITTGEVVAVKIIRAQPKYRAAGKHEVQVLTTLLAADPEHRNHCIQLRDHFTFDGHECIVTRVLGVSTFDFLRCGGYVPFPGSHVRAMTKQVLEGIAFLHGLGIKHTDIKPENILLMDDSYYTFTYNKPIPSSDSQVRRTAQLRRVLRSPRINLIDFGSAMFDSDNRRYVLGTTHYRSPEVILGLRRSYAIDLWSLGCVVVEFFTACLLFKTSDLAELLAMMETFVGSPIDDAIIKQVYKEAEYKSKDDITQYFSDGALRRLPPDPHRSRYFASSMKRLDQVIPQTSDFNRRLLDLLRKIFVFDPVKRLTAQQALAHPWFEIAVDDDGTEAERIASKEQIEVFATK